MFDHSTAHWQINFMKSNWILIVERNIIFRCQILHGFISGVIWLFDSIKCKILLFVHSNYICTWPKNCQLLLVKMHSFFNNLKFIANEIGEKHLSFSQQFSSGFSYWSVSIKARTAIKISISSEQSINWIVTQPQVKFIRNFEKWWKESKRSKELKNKW